MWFGMVGRMGSGMRQVTDSFGIGPQEWVILVANVGHQRSMQRSCVKVREPSERRFWVVRGVGLFPNYFGNLVIVSSHSPAFHRCSFEVCK